MPTLFICALTRHICAAIVHDGQSVGGMKGKIPPPSIVSSASIAVLFEEDFHIRHRREGSNMERPRTFIWTRCRGMLAALTALVSLVSIAVRAEAAPAQFLTLMTHNVYFGADLSPVLDSPNPDLPLLWEEVKASDIPARATRIADKIAIEEPEIVALQEAAQWSGPGPNGSTIHYDFLVSILSELALRGEHYAPVKVIDDLDITAPVAPGYVHFVDRDILLARTDLPSARLSFSNVQAASYSNLLSVSTALGPITIPRSWISADVSMGGKKFRFITTHLESLSSAIQEAQAGELIAGPADTSLPVVMAGDFNSNANGLPNLPDNTSTYENLLGAGFSDIWTAVGHNRIGNTCCQEADLTNFPSGLSERIDLVLTNGGIKGVAEGVIDNHFWDRVSSPAGPLWPSDHGGLVAVVKMP